MSSDGTGAFPDCMFLRHEHNHRSPIKVVLLAVQLSKCIFSRSFFGPSHKGQLCLGA